eukprot:TRINITY_DN485_c0_g1_i2.p2 TRINITY_DN485_c0_g1~~TRINITY_DN485_c0_g1_i2.p2  ORF type:complete len:304 (+),score=123.93 TRINITY_DN485_c0_g1_i2:173-1084(+)
MQDRLRDLQREEESETAKGDAEGGSAGSVIAAFQAEQEDDELQESLRRGNEVRKDMRAVRSLMDEMVGLQQNIIDEIQRDKQRTLTSELDRLVDESSAIVQRIADTLKSMDEENKAFVEKNGVTTVSRIRENQTMSLLREYRELVERYQKIQREHQLRMRSRIRDEVLVVNPEATEDQIEAVVEQGGGEVFAGDILHGRHEEAKENYLMIEDQHRDILRIEESLAELHQIFVDMAALVEMQGDVLENIMKNVSKSVSYTEAGLKEVIKAEEYQKKARRKMCYLIIIALVIMGAVLLSVVSTQQ